MSHSSELERPAPHEPRALVVEKPVCTESDELAALSELAAPSGVAVAVDHSRRMDAPHQRLAVRLRQGEFGALIGGRWTYYGGWLHNGVHVVDTVRMLFGTEPECVSASRCDSGRPGDIAQASTS